MMPIPFQGEPIKNFMEGMETGGNLFQRLLQKKQMQQQSQQFSQNLLFQKMQEQRLQQAEQRKQMAAPAELQKLEMETNPSAKATYLKDLETQLTNVGFPPLVAKQIIAKETGYNPDYESPEEKRSAEYADFQRREQEKWQRYVKEKEYESTNPKPGINPFAPTTAFITHNQKLIQSIDNVLPQIKKLYESSDIPGQFVGKLKNQNEQAKYEAKVSTITDSLVGALGLPKTNESLELVEKMVRLNTFESEYAYKLRLQELYNDLQERKNTSLQSLQGTEAVPYSPEQEELANKNTELANSIGEITENDIQETMKINNLSREEVIRRLKERGNM